MSENLLVVKYGSSSVTNSEGVDQNRLNAYAANLAGIISEFGLIIVSSGALLTGKYLLKQLKGEATEAPDETLATIGSPHVVTAWQRALQPYGQLAGQILVTHRELDDTEESGKLESSLRDNLRYGVVSVVNENDALSDNELAKLAYGGDNDGLASHVARRMAAQAPCIFTDVDGLLKGTELLRTVPANDYHQAGALDMASADSAKKSKRPSGMPYKVNAAIKAANAGIDTYIANADISIESILSGEAGTHFQARQL